MSLEPPEFQDKFDWWSLRQTLGDWFFRFQMGQFLVPPGTMAFFPTSSPPEGWVECDGTDYEEAKFPNLFKVIGPNGAGAGFMRVPNEVASVGVICMIKV